MAKSEMSQSAADMSPAVNLKSTKQMASPSISSNVSYDKDNQNPDIVGAGYSRGGKTKKMASGGMTASRRADGIAQRGKTKGRMV